MKKHTESTASVRRAINGALREPRAAQRTLTESCEVPEIRTKYLAGHGKGQLPIDHRRIAGDAGANRIILCYSNIVLLQDSFKIRQVSASRYVMQEDSAGLPALLVEGVGDAIWRAMTHGEALSFPFTT